MKAKYSIPYTLDKKLGNTMIPLKDEKTGMGIDKKVNLRTIVLGAVAGMVYMFLITKSSFANFIGIHKGSFLGFSLFTLGYVGVCYFALRSISIPELYGYNVIFPLFNYLSKLRNRDIKTASYSKYLDAANLVGLVEPTKDGKLRFANGEYGIIYKIIGTASNNAFSVDRKVTIDNFENFLRTLPDQTTYAFITNTAGQKVDRQIKHLFELFDAETDETMINFIAEEIRELAKYIRFNFVALHQYMIIRSTDIDALNSADKATKMFIEQKGNVITYLARPSSSEQMMLLKSIYTGSSEADDQRLQKWLKQDDTDSELAKAGGFDLKPKKTKPLKIKKKG